MTLTNHLYGTDWFMVNETWFQSLPEGLKQVVRDAAEVANVADRGAQRLLDSRAMGDLKAAGLKIYAPTETERNAFKDRVQQSYIDWLSKEVDKTWIDKFLKAVSEAEAR